MVRVLLFLCVVCFGWSATAQNITISQQRFNQYSIHEKTFWVGYGVAQANWSLRHKTKRSSFGREVYVLGAALQIWSELKEKNRAVRSKNIDQMAYARRAGFLKEYIWAYLRRQSWKQPQKLRMAAFYKWAKRNLKGHRPNRNPGVRVR